MLCSNIHTQINPYIYDAIVSIGNKCPTAMVLRELKVYKESYPFDFVPTTPSLILKYMKDPSEFYPEKGKVRTKDSVWFGHFDIDEQYDTTMETFHRRFARLFRVLEEKKRVLFVYTSEADIYNEMNLRYTDTYSDLKMLIDYIKEKYNYSDFLIVAIHTNKSYPNESNIVNYTIQVESKYLSENLETHIPEVYTPYRTLLKDLFRKIFSIPK